MWKQLKTLLNINKSDFLFALGMTALPFLLVHLVTAGVMLIIRPDESIFIGGVLLPISVGIAAFAVTGSNAMITFTQAVQFGRTRKRALGLTLSMAAIMTVVAMVLGAALLVFERDLAMPLWRVLSGNLGLLVDDFGIVWWGIPVGALVGYVIGLWYGTMCLRFGSKAYWAFLIVWVGGLAIFQALPWRTHEVTNILIPVLVVLMLLACVWSVRTMLKLSVTK